MYSIDEEMQFLNKYFMLVSISNDFFAGLDNSGFQMLQKNSLNFYGTCSVITSLLTFSPFLTQHIN